MVASPSAYDPVQHPVAAKKRRDLVLLRMFEQGYLTRPLYESAKAAGPADPRRPDVPGGGHGLPVLHVLDQAAGRRPARRRPAGRAARVRGRPAGQDDDRLAPAERRPRTRSTAWLPNGSRPARLARRDLQQGRHGPGDGRRRQLRHRRRSTSPPRASASPAPRSSRSCSPRRCAQDISPQSTWASKKLTYILKGGERFTVNNYEDAYAGVTTLANATTFSDNSVYAQVGKQVKTKNVAELARRMGIRTPVSTQPRDRRSAACARASRRWTWRTRTRRSRPAASWSTARSPPARATRRCRCPGPVGIERIDECAASKTRAVELDDGTQDDQQAQEDQRVLKPRRRATRSARSCRPSSRSGTATRAQIPGVMIAGKTGTTENYGDAWFVGWTKEYTVAVWVGYPDEFKPMETEFQGEPVAGGTYPAGIWKTFMQALLKIDPLPEEGRRRRHRQTPTPTPGAGRAAARDDRAGRRPRRRPARAAGPRRRSRNSRRRRSSRRRARRSRHAGRRPPTGDAEVSPPEGDGAAAAAGTASRSRGRQRTAGIAASAGRPDADRRGAAQTITTGSHKGCAANVVSESPTPADVARPCGTTHPLIAQFSGQTARRPGGQGRETSREPSAQKRHGSSAAFVIPIRGPGHVRQRRALEDHGPGRRPATCRSPPARSPAPA